MSQFGSVDPRARSHWAESPTKVLGFVAALLSVVTGVFALLAQIGAFGDFRISFLPGRPVTTTPATIALSLGEGKSGTPFVVTGRDFEADELVEISFHTQSVAIAQTDSAGAFTVNATVPGTFDAFGGQQFDIVAVGRSSVKSARAPFKLVTGGTGGDSTGSASIALSTGSGRSGTEVIVTGTNFRAGEEVRLYFHVDEVGSATVGPNGQFTQPIKIPSSYDMFAPQQFSIRARGTSSAKSASRPFELQKR